LAVIDLESLSPKTIRPSGSQLVFRERHDVVPRDESRRLLANLALLGTESLVELTPRLETALDHRCDAFLVSGVERCLRIRQQHLLEFLRRNEAHHP